LTDQPEVIGKNTRIGDNVKGIVSQIIATEREKKGVQTDIDEIYAAAKEAGFSVKALRKAVHRAMLPPTKREDEDKISELADLYGHAFNALD
jgi:uncharacterized protein (UPF0335 family)